jgi:ATP-dependent exoDNAse (exonuclease V) alpha subunit
VKNGDRWLVTATNPDGSMALRRGNGGGEVSLPADYVAQHVELAYATTAYRSQGRTTDTAHALVAPATTREVLYVSATRGRESNSLLSTHRSIPTRPPVTNLRSHNGPLETCSPAC